MSNNNVQPFNRPSVIIFNPNSERNSVIINNPNYINQNNPEEIQEIQQDEQNNAEISVIVNNPDYINQNNSEEIQEIQQDEQNNAEINQDQFDELSNDSFNNYFDNNYVPSPLPHPQLSDEEYLSLIRDNYELHETSEQKSKKYGLVFSHFKTLINPEIYEHVKPDNFINLFRDIFQDIFNRVLEKVDLEFKDKFSRVKINITGEDLSVNLEFLPLSELSSELFLIQLYRVLQSRRDVVTGGEMQLSFTFLPKDDRPIAVLEDIINEIDSENEEDMI